ncbi:MAG: hypothetical protein KAI73_12435 [Rhodospirillaceae bacterium]|nr:hypothetical protein [Rhodospirillaceae bacterium]
MLDLPAQEYKINIDDIEYTLHLAYSDRAAAWYFGIADAVGVDIVRGIKVVQGWPLLFRAQDSRLPDGDFFMFFGGGDNIGREGFNDGARLFYWTAEELTEEGALPTPLVSLVGFV